MFGLIRGKSQNHRAIGRAAARGIRSVILVVPLLAAVMVTPAVAADNLRNALAHAYRTSPELQAERSRQRATDEQLPQAQAGWRPTVEASADIGLRHLSGNDSTNSGSDPVGFKVTLVQPVFRGFRTQAATAQANEVIAAGRQELLSVEQDLLLKAVAAYMDVVLGRDVVRLRHSQVGILSRELKAAKGRFELGDVTRTDVAQALSRYQSAIANHDNAKADLSVSVAEFLRFIGRAPGKLQRPGLPGNIPPSLEDAVRRAERDNPEIIRAIHNEGAARHFVDVRHGALLPRVTLEAEYGYNTRTSTSSSDIEEAVVRGVLTVPIYQSGAAYSRLREAKELASRRRSLVLNAKRKIRSQVMRVWSRYREAERRITVVKAQVGAAIMAVEGVRKETLLGTRTTQETLDAERELMNARIDLAVARRDYVVRAYEVLAAVGRLNIRALGIDVAIYDPEAYTNAIDHKWTGATINAQ